MHSENEVHCSNNLRVASVSSKQLNDRSTHQDTELQMGLSQEGWGGKGLIKDRVQAPRGDITKTNQCYTHNLSDMDCPSKTFWCAVIRQ